MVSPTTLERLTRSMMNLTTEEEQRSVHHEVRDTLLEVTGGEGNTILHMAVINEQLDTLRTILNLVDKAGLQEVLDEPNKTGSTALHLAVQAGQIETVRILLASKACPNKLDQDGETVVHAAVRGNSLAMMQILLEFQADANIPSHFGKFPLHLAVERNLLPLVRLMADHGGVDMEARDQVAGRTALHLAVDRQLEEMVRYLVKEAKVDLSREDYSGASPLYFAETCKNQNILKIVNKGVRKQK